MGPNSVTEYRAPDFDFPDSTTTGPPKERVAMRHGFSSSVTGAVRELQSLWNTFNPPTPQLAYSPLAPASVVWTTNHESAFKLQKFAWDRLALIRVRGDADPTPEASESLKIVVRDFVADNGPTPQIGATPTGSVELQWLVAGTLVSALFDASGEYNLYALNPDRSVLLDTDVPYGEEPSPEVRDQLSKLLFDLGTRVTSRPASWS